MIHNQTRTANDAYLSLLGHKKEVTKVLIIGNNPLELAEIYDKLSNTRRKYYMVDVSFSLKDGRQRAIKNNPDVILLDDNLEYQDMKSFTREIKSNHKFSHLKTLSVYQNFYIFLHLSAHYQHKRIHQNQVVFLSR